jgi:outer membrane protein TolC
MEVGQLVQRSSIGWSVGPSLTVPFFQGGQLAAAVDVARAQRDEAFIAYRAAVLTALEDVENASVGLAQETQRVEVLAGSAASFQQAMELSRSLYQAGATSFLDLLTAERSLYSAEDSLIQSRVAVTTDYVALNKALGGGWDGRVDVSTPEIVDRYTGPHFPHKP